MIRLAFFFSALFLAAVMDMRTRTIPDCLVVLVALTSMLPPGQPNLLGVFAGLPLLLAGITIGGIGGLRHHGKDHPQGGGPPGI